MKFTLIIAALLATTVAAKCDPAKVTAIFYDDNACKIVNEEMTKKYGGHIKPEDLKKWDEECHAAP